MRAQPESTAMGNYYSCLFAKDLIEMMSFYLPSFGTESSAA